MDHNTCRDNLSAYLDGELPQQEKALLEAHLAGCPDCRAVLGQLGTVSGILKKHVMEPVPLSLKGEVLSGPKKAARPWLKPVLAFSAAAASLLVVMNLVKTSEESLSPTFYSARAGGDMSAMLSMPAGEAGQAAPSVQAETAPAPAATSSGLFAESKKISGSRSAPASVRGSYAQAKYAAPRALGALGGGAAKEEAAGRAGAAGNSAAGQSGAEFRGPVCVYVSSARSREETYKGMGEEESDDFSWYLGKALIFLEKAGTPSPSAGPGRLVFVKKDGSRKIVTEKDCSLGFIFFDGVQDPLVVTDFLSITGQYNKYFGTALEPIGDELPD